MLWAEILVAIVVMFVVMMELMAEVELFVVGSAEMLLVVMIEMITLPVTLFCTNSCVIDGGYR